jgi:leucyl/phenylalanyl-tRNA--protein transferase
MPQAPDLDVDLLLKAYAHGVFPMARRRDDRDIYFVSPEERGVIPLETFHVPRRLARTVRSDRFVVRADSAFQDVIRACAERAPDREESWINPQIDSLYCRLHDMGHAHSIECWRNDRLMGGLYGVSLGAAFFGESMFSRERDASKVALVHLVARLKAGGYRLLDAQFLTDHLTQFGAVAIPREHYLELLAEAIIVPADFACSGYYCPDPSGNSGTASFAPASGEVAFTGTVDATTGANWPGWFVLQLITQTS